MKQISKRTCANLDSQGYTFLTDEEKGKLNIALRITPAICIVLVIIGLVLEEWGLFAVLTIFGVLGATFSQGQPIDVLYNFAMRRFFKMPKLPPSPPQKRFACAIGALFLAGATLSSYFGALAWAYVFGIGYILAAGIMAATHWCIGSWIYNWIFSKRSAKPAS